MTTKRFLAIVLVLSAMPSSAQTASPWRAKQYHSLLNGNQLYASCQEWNKSVSVATDNHINVKSAPSDKLYDAGTCWGYILGIVDSIPVGEGFDPDEDVRASQYIDVVFAYLRDRPAVRHLPAYVLVREALTDAFPQKWNSK